MRPRTSRTPALAIPTDVADYDQVAAAGAQVEDTFGPIDVWINVAFTSVFAPFDEIKPAEFRRVTEVSYLGFVYGTMVALSRMRPRDRGTIVQVGSALGARSIPLQSAYCGAKHAINGFTESVRTELMHDASNIHITIAQMPAVNTPQFSWVLSRLPNHPQPVPPIYQPEVVARGVVFAADHPRRKQSWVGASTVGTLVGQKLAPATLDRYLAKAGYSSQQTIDAVERDLSDERGLLYRYRGDDGLDGSEGTFLLCTFWLAHALAVTGQIERARVVLDRAARCATSLGLFSEQIDSDTGELLGNFPQAFSHLGLVTAAHALALAEAEQARMSS